MDNLRSIVDLLFTKREIDDLLESFIDAKGSKNSKIIDKDSFKELYLSQYHRYSGNQLNSLFDIIRDEWSKNPFQNGDGSEQNVFNILLQLSKEMLENINGEPYCKKDSFLRWHKVTEETGEDLFVTSYLAATDNGYIARNRDFIWNPYLSINDSNLSGITEKGLYELHSHFYGSSLVGTLNWLKLMNFPKMTCKGQFKKIKNMSDSYRKVMLAAFLRVTLFKIINNKRDVVFESVIDRWLVSYNKLQYSGLRVGQVQSFIGRLRREWKNELDYAIPNNLSVSAINVSSRICLIGERQLLYKCFQYVHKGNPSKMFISMFYLYLIIKSQFRCAMVQVNKDFGFENFQYYDGKKSLFLDGNRIYENALARNAFRIAVEGTNVKYIEHRMTVSNVSYLKPFLKEFKEGHRGIECPYIIHFIKREDSKKNYDGSIFSSMECRNNSVRQILNIETKKLERYIFSGESNIVGIDAANSEFYCRPEVFSTVYTRLRQSYRNPFLNYFMDLKPYRLGVTFHVGEDFYDIIDGLRAVDEAIIFLNLHDGDRIGHGTVLGIDIEHYYDEKNLTVIMPKQVMLDNMAWLIDRMNMYGLLIGAVKDNAKRIYKRLVEDVYGEWINIETYINSWLLRGDEPYPNRKFNIYQSHKREVVSARQDIKAKELFHSYHFNPEVKKIGSESTEWKINKAIFPSFVRVMCELQMIMQNKIGELGIAIECNPTSNLRIGNISKYINHPILKFNNDGLKFSRGEIETRPNLMVSVNTDDAGIFATSLEKEFSLMAVALEKEVDEDGQLLYENSSIYKWLDNIRKKAISYRFDKQVAVSMEDESIGNDETTIMLKDVLEILMNRQ